jgi:hypothetical protein
VDEQFQKLKKEQDELRKRLNYGSPGWALRHLLHGDPRLIRMWREAKERNAHDAAPCRVVYRIADRRRRLEAGHRLSPARADRRSGARRRGAGRPAGRRGARRESGSGDDPDDSSEGEADPAGVGAAIVVARRWAAA